MPTLTKHTIVRFSLLVIFFWGGTVYRTQTMGAEITPLPKSIKQKEFTALLDNSWKICVDTTNAGYNFSAIWLHDKLLELNTLNLEIVDFSAAPANKRIILGHCENNYVKTILATAKLTLPPVSTLGSEGYIIENCDSLKQIIVSSYAQNGVFYGIQTLLQLVKQDNSLDGISIMDFPDKTIRAAYYPTGITFGWINSVYVFTQAQKDYINWLASLKINTVFLPQIGSMDGEFYKDETKWKQAYQELFNYARTRFIEPIPHLAITPLQAVASSSIEFYEGWWVQDEVFKFTTDSNTAQAVLAFENILSNSGFEIDTDGDGTPNYWRTISKTGATWTRDSNIKYSGNYSMRLDVPVSTSESIDATLMCDSVIIEPQSHYFIIGKAKSQNITGNAKLVFYARNSLNQAIVLQSDQCSGTKDWFDFGGTISVPASGTTIQLYARIQDGSGTLWLDDIKIYRVNSSLRNVIRSTDTDIKITNLNKSQTYIEGTDYQIINGTTSNKFSENMSPFQIERLPGGNIGQTEQVLVSYDTLLNSTISKWYKNLIFCFAKDEVYSDFSFPAINKIISYLNPKYIDIKLDEIRGFYRDSRMREKFGSNSEALAYYINSLNSYAKSLNPSCRLWMWEDMISPYHNGADENYQVPYGGLPGRTAEAAENELIDKDVIMDIWWYDSNGLSQMAANIDFFTAKGYNIMGGAGNDIGNIINWSEFLTYQSNSLGGVITWWMTGGYEEAFTVFADHFWNTRYSLLFFSSFELDQDANGTPDGWLKTGDPEYSTDGTNSYGFRYAGFPNCAVKVTGTTDIFKSDYIKVNPQLNYILSSYIKSDATTAETPTLKILWFDKYENFISENKENISNVSEDYDLYKLIADSPRNAAYAQICLEGQNNGNSSFWYDIIRLTEKNEINFQLGNWHLDESSGIIAHDSSGNNHDGILINGPTWDTDGKISGSLSFDLTQNQYVDCGNLPNWDLAETDHTIMLWFKTTEIGSLTLVERFTGGTPGGGYNLIVSDGRVCFEERADGGSMIWVASPMNNYNDGIWHHVAAVVKTNEKKGYLYIDGELKGSDIYYGNLLNHSDSLKIGSMLTLFPYTGAIDEVSIYKRAFNTEEIIEEWGNGSRIGYWCLNEASGLIAYDSSGNERNGNLINGPIWDIGGKIEGALTFDGTQNQYVDCGNLPNWDLAETDHTIMLWFKTTEIGSLTLVERFTGGTPGGGYNLIVSDGRVCFEERADGGSMIWVASPMNNYNDGIWHHVAAVVKTNEKKGYLYIDGELKGSDIYYGNLLNHSDSLKIGSMLTLFPYTGTIDNVSIYKRALDIFEIQKYATQ